MSGDKVVSAVCVAVVAGAVALSAGVAAGQSASGPRGEDARWSPPRTAWGAPDLQGVWDYRTMTPLQRPREFTGKTVMSPEEAVAYTARRLEEQADYDASPSVHAKWWLDYGTELTDDKRTSLIVDPPDGRIPALTDSAKQRSAARGAYRRAHPADGADSRGLSERCLTFGTPRLPGGYNNNYQILQTPDHVVILSEMVHDARIVPLDGRPYLPEGVRQWMGNSVGYWEGDTLVVESKNFTDKTSSFSPSVTMAAGNGTTLHLTERFTRVAGDTLLYEFTINDQQTFTRPFSAAIPMKRGDALFEYACHEGNYGLLNILSGARQKERELQN